MKLRTAQTTLKRKQSLKGVGLHSGATIQCVIHPAPANHGIVFVRSDLKSCPHIKADISKVHRTDLSTTLANQGAVVATVEHLMAALYGMGIDNALIEVSGPEVPIMDGSSQEFVEAIKDAGIRELGVSRKVLRLRRRIEIQSGDKYIVASPSEHFAISGKIQFNHKAIGEQNFKFDDFRKFEDEIASARTFGFLKEVEYLNKKGLALGGSLENAIVLDEERILNPEGLRYKNEFIRHKVLDAIGDFALLGLGLQASVEVFKAGHELHTAFINKVLSSQLNYQIIDLESEKAQKASDAENELMLDEEDLSAALAF